MNKKRIERLTDELHEAHPEIDLKTCESYAWAVDKLICEHEARELKNFLTTLFIGSIVTIPVIAIIVYLIGLL